MKHETIQTMLARREELSQREETELQAHLQECAACPQVAHSFAAQDVHLRVLTPVAPRADFQAQVLAAAHQRAQSTRRVSLRSRIVIGVMALALVVGGSPIRGAVAETIRHIAQEFGLMNDPLFQKTAKEMHGQGQRGYQDRPPEIQAVMRRMYYSDQHYQTLSGLFVDHDPTGGPGSLRFVIRDPSSIQTASYSSDDGSGPPIEETLGGPKETILYDPIANVYTVNSHGLWHVTPLDQIPLSVAMPYYGPTAIYGMRGVVAVLAGMAVHPDGLILSSFVSNKVVTIAGQPALSGRHTWELRGVQVPGVPVVPTLGDSWTMWVDQETGVVLRLEYYRGRNQIGWAAIQDFTVNEPASQLPHYWSMPATAKKLDMTAYIQRHTRP
jgi:hypothetical protein